MSIPPAGNLQAKAVPLAARDFPPVWRSELIRTHSRFGLIFGARKFAKTAGKGEALIDLTELKDGEGVLEVKVGDRIRAIVEETSSFRGVRCLKSSNARAPSRSGGRSPRARTTGSWSGITSKEDR